MPIFTVQWEEHKEAQVSANSAEEARNWWRNANDEQLAASFPSVEYHNLIILNDNLYCKLHADRLELQQKGKQSMIVRVELDAQQGSLIKEKARQSGLTPNEFARKILLLYLTNLTKLSKSAE